MKAAAQVRLNSIRGRFINKRRIFRKASIRKEKMSFLIYFRRNMSWLLQYL